MNNATQTLINFDRRSELNSFFKKVKDQELSDLDIYEYIENFTDKFNETKFKLLIRDMLSYLRFKEVQLKESVCADTLTATLEGYSAVQQINLDGLGEQNDANGYFIGNVENKNGVNEEAASYPNEFSIENPTNDVYPEPINPIIEKIMQRIRIESQYLTGPERFFPQIFIEGGFILFFRMVMKYTQDDQSPVVKFSNLFHFFEYEHILNCTQPEYISFIESHYDLKISKILPVNNKYTEVIKPLLERSLRGF